MASIQHILVALDFSESSRLALEYAELLARQFGAAVDLVHVVTPLVPPMPAGCAPPFFSNPGEAHLVEARACLENHADELRSRGLSVATLLLEGSPLESILGQAQKRHCDLLVLGTHGRSGMAHMLLGSVAEKILRRAPCPVLTVRHPSFNHKG